MRRRVCIGYGDTEGVCENAAGSSHSQLWCQSCDDERRAVISAQLEAISARWDTHKPMRDALSVDPGVDG